MKIIKLITKRNQSGKPLYSVGGGVQHCTGNGEDTALNNFNYFNYYQVGANAHFFIDASGVYQFVETNRQAYHAKYPANGNRWGCEMCETKNPDKFKKIWDLQVKTWVHLFTEVANPKITVINQDTLRGHFEENKVNHATDPEAHQDPRSYFNMFGKTMGDMRNEVQNAINDKLNPKIEVKKLDDYKIKALKDAFTEGLIGDCEQWMRKADEPAPVWFVLVVALNVIRVVKALIVKK